MVEETHPWDLIKQWIHDKNLKTQKEEGVFKEGEAMVMEEDGKIKGDLLFASDVERKDTGPLNAQAITYQKEHKEDKIE